jgi:hypothetical protein
MTQPIQAAEFTSDLGSAPQCEQHCPIHLDQIRQLQPEMLPLERAQQMAEFFGTLPIPPDCAYSRFWQRRSYACVT